MGKGALTRERILDEAVRLASRDGLVGLSIGGLAGALALSKSGLFAHFGSKEALQLAVLERAGAMFHARALVPLEAIPPGPIRLRAMLRGSLDWIDAPDLPGGCPIMSACFELAGRDGVPRQSLAERERASLRRIAAAFRECAPGLADPDQAAFEFRAICLGYHVASRVAGDPDARDRAATAFEALLARARKPEAHAPPRAGGHPPRAPRGEDDRALPDNLL